jgi:hypothetical protein
MRACFNMFLPLAFLSLATCASAGNVCDDIHSVKEGWDAMSVIVAASVLPDAQLSRREQRELEEGLGELMLATAVVGEALKTGNRVERRLGAEIMGSLSEMQGFDDSDKAHHINAVIGDLTESLEDTVDYCDRQ